MKNSVLLFIFCCGCLASSFAQDLPNSRRSSAITQIYKITDDQARAIYRSYYKTLDEPYFARLIDTYPTDSAYRKELPHGHYLHVYASAGQLQANLVSVNTLEMITLSNKRDLLLRFVDEEGNEVQDVQVRAQGRNPRMDAKTRSFTSRKSNKNGMIEATYGGHTNFFEVERSANNMLIVRTGKRIISTFPINHIISPYYYVRNSIRYSRPQAPGAYYRVKRIFSKKNRAYSGYMVFSQPKYKPGDTLRMKAIVTNKKGKPMVGDLEMEWHSYKTGYKKFGEISSYRPGAYQTEQVLHDSLNLSLDMNYMVRLVDKKGKARITGTFKLEEYELKSYKYTLRLGESEHWPGKPNTAYLKGTDSNDLPVPDARYEVYLLPKAPESYFSDYVFVPDTLWTTRGNLESRGDTKVEIPDSVFREASHHYTLHAVFLDGSNERHEKSATAHFAYPSRQISFTPVADSVKILFLEHNKEVPMQARIQVFSIAGKPFRQEEISLPATVKLQPYDAHVVVSAHDLEKSYIPEKLPVSASTYRTADSLFIEVNNPAGIPFQYFVYYNRSREIARGSSTSFSLAQASGPRHYYHLSLQYVWGGKAYDEEYTIPYQERQLSLEWDVPTKVFPGQRADITLRALDAKGSPLPDTDITAYGITKKFDDYSMPAVPYYGKHYKGRTFINTFRQKSFSQKTNTNPLEWSRWNPAFGLDSLEFYKFLYPQNGWYHTRVEAETTQFAPFVVNKGRSYEITAIYVNNQLIYYSGTHQRKVYSFPILPVATTIRIWAGNKLFTYAGYEAAARYKSIFSIDYHRPPDFVGARELSKKEMEAERAKILRNLLLVDVDYYHQRDAYVKQGDQVYLLDNPGSTHIKGSNVRLMGPVKWGQLTYVKRDGFSTSFPFEQGFRYDIKEGLVKMRQLPEGAQLSKKTTWWSYELPSFRETVLTEEAVKAYWKQKTAMEKMASRRYDNPRATAADKGRLQLQLVQADTARRKVKNILLFNQSNPADLRVYPGHEAGPFHDLLPGLWRAIVLYEGNFYSEAANLEVRAGGLNHHRLVHPQVMSEALFIQKIDSLIQDNPIIDNYARTPGDIDKNRMASWYTTQYQPGTPPAGFTRKISGIVYSKIDNLPLPGANVLVKGTNYGTVTDVNGEYTLYVPEEGAILLINFIGFASYEGHSSEADRVKLVEDVMMLQEVVVTGYGVQTQKRNLSGSVVSLETSLQGRAAGVQIRGASSVVRTPRFRNGGGGGEGFVEEPLYIIDGVPGSAAGLLNPDDIVSMEVLKGEAATAIYGARASAGAIIITTSKGGSLLKPQGVEGWGMEEGESMEAMNSLRTNFRDYAFWQPTLRTDKEGRARFEVTFPDDITGWNLYAIGMGPNRQTGTSASFTQSYKPLMAQLNLPRFMVRGDSAQAIGKSVNYSGDTLHVSRQFTVQGTTHSLGSLPVANTQVDSLWFSANSDSLMVAYRLDMGSYYDGEQRKIPVFPQGVEETKGVFMVLDSDTTVRVPFEPGLGQGTLYLQADVLSVWMEEAEKLSRYFYNCNEQMASKLIGFLIQEEIKTFKNQPFDKQKEIQRLIKTLENNQNADGSWAWFNKGEGSLWISIHTAKALDKAQAMGYRVSYHREEWVEFLWGHLLDTERTHQRLMVLDALKEEGDKFAMKEMVVDLVLRKQADEERKKPWNLHDHLLLAHLQHKAGLTPDTLWWKAHRQETYFGGVFFGEKRYDMVVNEVSTTLAAYRLLADSQPNHPDLPRIRQYFLETKGPQGWTNTYRSASILSTLLPDLIREKATYRPSRVQVQGQAAWIDQFPHRMEVDGTTDIHLKKEGNMPLFVTGYQQFWNPAPAPVDKDFVVKTSFSTGSTLLEAGKPVQLKVVVKVLKYGEYVMIEVPIPAGCSYADKPQSRANREVHREYFLEKTSIFCSSLSPGTYTFTIELLPRYTGTYTLNPAKAELMYFPVFYGRNGIGTVKVK